MLTKLKTRLFGPFFSIVIPTRDRPEFIELGLEVLLAQTFQDFEVIVSDNGLTKSCKSVVDKFNDPRIRYIKPPEPLEMSHHWEFACSQARGRYVSVLIDKTFLHTEALSLLYASLKQKKYDLVSWTNETYVPIDEKEGYSEGYYSPQYQASAPFPYSPNEELTRRMECKEDLWAEGNNYVRGKICFGAFSAKLIKKIKRVQGGNLFHSVCPDYTATVSALALAKNALDMGQPLMASFLTSVSNGMNYYQSPSYALNFLQQVDPSGGVLQDLPIRNLYASTHNLIAGDYLRVKRTLGDKLFPDNLNIKNLIDRIISDLAVVGFRSDEDLIEQIKHLLEVNPEFDLDELAERIKAERKEKKLTGSQAEDEILAIYQSLYKRFSSPLTMAQYMASHYQEELSHESEETEPLDAPTPENLLTESELQEAEEALSNPAESKSDIALSNSQ